MGRHHKHKKMSDKDAEDNINQQLENTGKKKELKAEVKMACRERVKETGLDRITLEDLVQEISPVGSQLVPDEIKEQLLDDVKKFLEEQAED